MPVDPRRLQVLLDRFRVGELLTLVTLEEIADAWCRYQRRPRVEGVDDEDPNWWAVDLLMDEEFRRDESRLRTTLDLVLDRASDAETLGVYAAGPLEDFIKAADEDRLCWIERRAEESPRFRQALKGVWVSSLPPDAFERMERAAGVPLARPAEDVVVDAVPGDLPGTVHIRRNGEVVGELETDPSGVQGMVDLIQGLIPPRSDE